MVIDYNESCKSCNEPLNPDEYEFELCIECEFDQLVEDERRDDDHSSS